MNINQKFKRARELVRKIENREGSFQENLKECIDLKTSALDEIARLTQITTTRLLDTILGKIKLSEEEQRLVAIALNKQAKSISLSLRNRLSQHTKRWLDSKNK